MIISFAVKDNEAKNSPSQENETLSTDLLWHFWMVLIGSLKLAASHTWIVPFSNPLKKIYARMKKITWLK